MDLEDIKEWHGKVDVEFDDDGMVNRSIIFLLAEVERLKAEIDICHTDTRLSTAQDCAEIAGKDFGRHEVAALIYEKYGMDLS